MGDPGSMVPGEEDSRGGGNGNPLQVFLPGESHGQRSLTGLQSTGLQRAGHDPATK